MVGASTVVGRPGVYYPCRVIPKDFKNGIHNFLLGARHLGEVVENKPASSLVVSLGKALSGTPPLLCGRPVAQLSLRVDGWWQKGHSTVKQMPCYKKFRCLLWRPLIWNKPKDKEEVGAQL